MRHCRRILTGADRGSGALTLRTQNVSRPLIGAPPATQRICLVFGSAKILPELFERLNQPSIVGEILAGIIIGPSVLHWIQPTDLMKALADLGVMFLLFRVGLEVKASELMQVGRTALAVATLGVAIPFPPGWVIMSYWGEPRIESIFVGTALVATSVGITAQVLAGNWHSRNVVSPDNSSEASHSFVALFSPRLLVSGGFVVATRNLLNMHRRATN